MKPFRKENPSSIFYWKDYENDEGLRVSSLSAQGLWMRLLCVAAKADPYGYILVNGFPLEATGVARLAGVTEGEAQSLLQELERNGVFSRDRKGRMFSRRLVRDAAVRAKAQKNGAKGGNPALGASAGNERKNSGSVNPKDNHRLKPPYPLPSSLKEEVVAAPPLPERNPDARVKLLAAMGVGPDGLTGPSSFIGGMNDMAEADKWAALGLSLDDQCRLIAERAAAMRRKQPAWMPRTFSYFSPALAEFVARRSSPVTVPPVQTTETNDAASKRAFLRKIAGGEK